MCAAESEGPQRSRRQQLTNGSKFLQSSVCELIRVNFWFESGSDTPPALC